MFVISTFVKIFSQENQFVGSGFPTTPLLTGGTINDSPTRHKIDLSGIWEVSVDGDEAIRVAVPSAFDGVAELQYERTFTIPDTLLGRSSIELVAYGINYTAEIWINDTFIGNHNGGYTSFSFPVSPEILNHSGPNRIYVATSNTLRTRDTVPIRSQMGTERNFGGIFRDIYLLIAPEVSIHQAQVKTTFLDGYTAAEMNIQVTAGWKHVLPEDVITPDPEFSENTYEIGAELLDGSRGFVIAQSQRVRLNFSENRLTEGNFRLIVRNPRLWSPDNPDLYLLSLVLYRNGAVHDRSGIVYGFRDIAVRGASILLNGQPFRGRGVVYHEYHPDFGSAINYEVMERDVALMKIANINLVRILHRPPHPHLLTLFDRYGILCMIEIPVVNVPGQILRNSNFLSVAKTYLQETIIRDRNHPSVLAWGLGDDIEAPHQGAIHYIQQLTEHGRNFDDRPYYAASRFPSNERISDYLEFAVINIPPGMGQESLPVLTHWKSRNQEKPLFIGKLGSYVEPGNLGGYSDPHSYEAQARYLLQMMEQLRDMAVTGILVNSFADWQGARPSMVIPGNDYTLHSLGILSADRKQRRGFEIVKALYRGEKIPPLIVGKASGGTPIEYVFGGFIVLIGFAYILNASRRFRENVQRSLFRPYNFFADVRDQRILSGFHTIYLGILISLTVGMTLASFLQHYQYNQILDFGFSHFLISDSLKIFLADALDQTWQLILLLSVICLAVLIVTAILIQVCSVFVKTRVLFSHSYIVAFWSALPFVGFIPLAMILYNVLETEFYVVPILGLLGLMGLWVMFRLFKGMSIIYDVLSFRVYVIGIFAVVSINGIMLLISEYAQATFTYLGFFVNLIEGFKI